MSFWRAWLCGLTLYMALGALSVPKDDKIWYALASEACLMFALYKPS